MWGREGLYFAPAPFCCFFLLPLFPCFSVGPLYVLQGETAPAWAPLLGHSSCLKPVAPLRARYWLQDSQGISMLQHGVLCGLQCRFLLWHGSLHRLLENTCSTMIFLRRYSSDWSSLLQDLKLLFPLLLQ